MVIGFSKTSVTQPCLMRSEMALSKKAECSNAEELFLAEKEKGFEEVVIDNRIR